jgi:hypothetical protein
MIGKWSLVFVGVLGLAGCATQGGKSENVEGLNDSSRYVKSGNNQRAGDSMLDLANKTILVSIRKVDEDGSESFDTFFGKVLRYNQNTVTVARRDGSEKQIPYDEDVYKVAEPGFYELQDGSTHENPDFIAQWVVYKNQETAEKYRPKD